MKPAKQRKTKKAAWELRLYIADNTPRSLLAMSNLQSLCRQYLQSGYTLRIIDIVKEPTAAIRDDILATPTLVRVWPTPQKTVIGSLSNADAVLKGLDLELSSSSHESRSHKPTVVMPEVGAA